MTTKTRMTIHEQETIKTLLAAGFSATAIAKRIDRDHKTVLAYSRDAGTVEEVKGMKSELADAYEGLARRMIDSITDEDISKINAYQRTIAAAAATDKMRLLNHQSTSNVSVLFQVAEVAEELQRRGCIVDAEVCEE